MSLSTRQRTSIFYKLIPLLGEEDADLLMSEFPASEHDQLVTRDHLRAELSLTREQLARELLLTRSQLQSEVQGLGTELRSEVQGLGTELHSEVQGLGTELRSEVQGLGTELHEFRSEVHAHINRAMGAMTGVTLGALGLLAAVGG
ncbi:MAG: hypothetical protein JJE52_02200 [Acidimicrobiia bacterium]|nr:hypothetical protein [Acidimicrobiia bacterium]